MKAYIVMIMGMKLPSFPTKGPASRVKIWNYPTEMVLKQMFSLVFLKYPGLFHHIGCCTTVIYYHYSSRFII